MTKRTSVNKFFLYRRMNQVFSKWKFFYKRYVNKVAFFQKGFYMEGPTLTSQSAVNRTKDLTKMVFWLLDLTEKGYSSKLTQDKRNLNVEWELVRGEGKFVELYGNINYSNKYKMKQSLLNEQIKASVVNFFWQKHDIILSDTDIKEISFDKISDTKKKVLKVQINDTFIAKFKNNKNHMIHSSFKKDMVLFKNKSSLVDFDIPVDYKRLDVLRGEPFLTSYDEIDLYVNTLGYTKNTGTADVNLFKQLIMSGHQTGRYKLLPSFVANFDDPNLMIPGIGFHNYLQIGGKKEHALLKFFLMNSKMFMPSDGINIKKDVTSLGIGVNYFHNYYRNIKQLSEQNCANVFDLNSMANLDTDYVQYSFYKSHTKIMHNFKFTPTTAASFSKNDLTNNIYLTKLYQMFLKMHNDLLFYKFKQEYSFKFAGDIVGNATSNLKKNLQLNDYNKINLNTQALVSLADKKHGFFINYYTTLHTMHDLFLNKWNHKLKQLFLLRVDLASNWGYYLDKQTLTDSEEGLSKKPSPYTMEHAYKLYIENVRYPTIIQSGKRPYKWTSIPVLQHSPFFYWMNNMRSNWFYIFDQMLGLFKNVNKGNDAFLQQTVDKKLAKWFSKLIILRYLDKNDLLYNGILKYLVSHTFFEKYFSKNRVDYFNFAVSLDGLLSMKETQGLMKSYDDTNTISSEKLLAKLSTTVPSHFYKNFPEMDIFSIFKYNDFWNYGSSRFFEVDWQTDSRSANLTRVPFLSKAGMAPSHFSFFSFFSRNFFEQTIGYQSWMKFRTFETPYMEEKSWREFTFLHQPLINLTIDITLSRYKSDLLYLMELGFHDIVLEKDIFQKSHYLFQSPKLRDIFDFQEFTAPFFFFDSERASFGNVPQRLPFEYVSSFGIPLLDKQWMTRDYLDSNVDRELDKGEWYVRTDRPDKQGFKHIWRKDRMVHKFIHENIYEKALVQKNMHLFMLTSIKGSKFYDGSLYEQKNQNNVNFPKVYGVLYTAMSVINDKKLHDNIELDHNNVNLEKSLLSQFNKLHVFYLKSWFYLMLRHTFVMSPQFSTKFFKNLIENKVIKTAKHGAFIDQFLQSLYVFSKIYRIVSQTLFFQQLNYVLFFKKQKSLSFINNLTELTLYFRLITFIFKNKNL